MKAKEQKLSTTCHLRLSIKEQLTIALFLKKHGLQRETPGGLAKAAIKLFLQTVQADTESQIPGTEEDQEAMLKLLMGKVKQTGLDKAKLLTTALEQNPAELQQETKTDHDIELED